MYPKGPGFFSSYGYNYFEYGMPIFIYAYFYVTVSPNTFCLLHAVYAICWILHYVKRLYENHFVHVHANRKKAISELYIDCFYYWGFSIWVGYSINSDPCPSSPLVFLRAFFFFLCWLLAVYGNYSCHLLLRNLKLKSRGEKTIPYPDPSMPLTKLFHYVSCPNYFYEAVGWFAFAGMTWSLAAYVFAQAGFVIMALWAKEKHDKYNKEFRNYPRHRRAIAPNVY